MPECGKLTTEYNADHHTDARHIVQSAPLSHCEWKLIHQKLHLLNLLKSDVALVLGSYILWVITHHAQWFDMYFDLQ